MEAWHVPDGLFRLAVLLAAAIAIPTQIRKRVGGGLLSYVALTSGLGVLIIGEVFRLLFLAAPGICTSSETPDFDLPTYAGGYLLVLLGFLSLMRDVYSMQASDRLAAAGERAQTDRVRQEEAKLRAILDGATGRCIISCDLAGVITSYSSGGAGIFGWTADEMVGKTRVAQLHVPGQGPTPEEIGAAVRSRGLFEAEIAMVRKSGEAFPALLTITPLHAPDGRLEGYVGIIKDITALKAVQDALRRERDFIRGVIETSELCIIGLSLPDGCVTMFNRGAEMMTGYRRDEIIGRPGSPALLSAEIADRLRRDVAQEADKAGGVRRFEGALRTRSGQQKALSWTYTVAKDDQGRPTHLVAFGFDLTETRQMQASLEKAKADLEKANAELERLANTDYLTGLVNRRQMTLLLEHEWARSRRNDKPLSVILLDIDRFKAVNDTHGHEAGDAALKHMANVLRGRVRASDIIVRYGGEEFILVLPETDLNGASGLAESLRRIVQESPVAYGDMRIALSSSLGVATIEPGQTFSAETLIRMADEAMYCAKSLGGNRVVIWNRVHEGQVEPALMASPEAQDLQKRIETIARRNDATVLESLYEFARGLEAPNPYTDRHSCNVTEYAVAVAREMGLGSTEVETIRRSGMLHDIGRAAIPASAIWKSGPLSKSDWALVCQHPVVSAKMVERLPFLRREAGIVRHHHERPDGRGYPDSLHGDAIPVEARIVAVADALDAITRDRPHRPARSLEDALAELHAGAPSQFDPRVVAAAQAAAKKAEGWPLARRAEPATVSPTAT